MPSMIISPTGTSPIIISPTGTNRIISARGDEPFTSVRVGALDSGGTTDYTTEAANDTIADVPGPVYNVVDPLDYTLYIGFTQPFNALKLKVYDVADSNNLSWKYFTTSGAFGDTVLPNIQETVVGLKNLRIATEGIVYWDMPNNWIMTQPQVGMPLLYWIIIFDLNTTPSAPTITRILKTTPP